MGQKTNPNILRIAKVKEWKSRYIEKKASESSTLMFRDLEIQKFIYQFFSKNELKIQNIRVYYSESSLHIYISFYNSLKPTFFNKKTKLYHKNNLSNLFQKKVIRMKQSTAKKNLYRLKTYRKAFLNSSQSKIFQNYYLLNEKTQRLENLKNYKLYIDKINHKTLNRNKPNLFVSKILKGLELFTQGKHNIFLNLQQVNKEANILQIVSNKNKFQLKKSFVKLRKFQHSAFFDNGFNMLYNFVVNKQDPSFLSEVIAFYLKKLKRPNFFLRFLKLTLKSLATEKLSKFERIQIKIKGRFNGAPRASHKFINIGKSIPVQTLNSDINYGESVAYTSNGTFGIKVWTLLKASKNYYV